jgi:hypothetical protein
MVYLDLSVSKLVPVNLTLSPPSLVPNLGSIFYNNEVLTPSSVTGLESSTGSIPSITSYGVQVREFASLCITSIPVRVTS